VENRIWLNLNTEGAFKQTLIGYVNGATNDYDGDMMPSVLTETVISTLLIITAFNHTRQGTSFEETDAVPLGYSSTIVGDFSI
jgi:hypothetical protein